MIGMFARHIALYWNYGAYSASQMIRDNKIAVLHPVKIALFIAIAANAIVLMGARQFYWDTRPGLPYKVDICSGTDLEDYYHFAAAVGLFAGIPASVGSLTQCVTQRSRVSACLAVAAFLLHLLPYWLGKTLEAYVIHIHASQVSQNCGD